MPDWKPTLGAVVSGDSTTFRVWAPECGRVELVIEENRRDIRPLTRDGCGYWGATCADVHAGARYRYRLDGDDTRVFPDPASRFQPLGVHGPSEVIDPSTFRWTDHGWQPPRADALVFYELHVGTFTPEGTFRGVIDRLPYLRNLGITAIELMPLADFPGGRNWGYDGAALYAPARCYGTPDDLRALVDAAHASNLAVCLDVVYNHLGPDGAYATAFSPYYLSSRHPSPWGAGLNLDGPQSDGVRRFLIENAIHWASEYHMDALRLDATHAIHDDTPRHLLAELTSEVHAHAGRSVFIVAEDHRNIVRLVEPVVSGGYGLDAVWADDFHHQVRVHAAGDRESYYADYRGTADDLAATLRQGWFFTGQPSSHFGARRGTDPSGIAFDQFIFCIQNHDQIGNRADGVRLHQQIDRAAYHALSALLLLAPETPLLFMGQEWAASTPFLFFTDHHEELGRLVTAGRREEFRAFAAFSDPRHRSAIPDPQATATFERSRLSWTERDHPAHAGTLRLYHRLIALRTVIPRVSRDEVDVRALDSHTVAMSLGAMEDPRRHLVIARLSGGAGDVSIPSDDATSVTTLLTTEDADVAGDAMPVVIEAGPRLRLRFERPGAIVLAPLLLRSA